MQVGEPGRGRVEEMVARQRQERRGDGERVRTAETVAAQRTTDVGMKSRDTWLFPGLMVDVLYWCTIDAVGSASTGAGVASSSPFGSSVEGMGGGDDWSEIKERWAVECASAIWVTESPGDGQLGVCELTMGPTSERAGETELAPPSPGSRAPSSYSHLGKLSRGCQ